MRRSFFIVKEYKKLYKAGKKWVAATITVAAVSFLGMITTQNVEADTVNSALTQNNAEQINNIQNDSDQVAGQASKVQNNDRPAQSENLLSTGTTTEAGKMW